MIEIAFWIAFTLLICIPFTGLAYFEVTEYIYPKEVTLAQRRMKLLFVAYLMSKFCVYFFAVQLPRTLFFHPSFPVIFLTQFVVIIIAKIIFAFATKSAYKLELVIFEIPLIFISFIFVFCYGLGYWDWISD